MKLYKIILALTLAAAIVFSAVLPIFKLPKPQGPYGIGTESLHLTDKARKELYGPKPGGDRELMVQLYYPSALSAKSIHIKPVPFIQDRAVLKPMAEQYGLPGFAFSHLSFVKSHAYKGAAISVDKESYPLVIISPGFGSSRFLHTSQAEALASHGYIVAVIDHTYNTFATVFPDGRMTLCDTDKLFSPQNDKQTEMAVRNALGQVLADDVAFVIDELEILSEASSYSRFKGTIDLNRIGLAGHSIGGATAYSAAYDPRVTSGVNMDGGLYDLDGQKPLEKPFLFLCSTGYHDELKTIRPSEMAIMEATIRHGGAIVRLENTAHLNFTDVQFFTPLFRFVGATGKLRAKKACEAVNDQLLEFFNETLGHAGL